MPCRCVEVSMSNMKFGVPGVKWQVGRTPSVLSNNLRIVEYSRHRAVANQAESERPTSPAEPMLTRCCIARGYASVDTSVRQLRKFLNTR